MFFIENMPVQTQQRIVCSIAAAVKYKVPANIVLAIAEQEGGKPGQWVRNTNSTYDVGTMQFNTSYLHSLNKYGITANDVAAKGCYPFELAAWRLHGHIIHDKGNLWRKVANYHSRTPKYNKIYRSNLIIKAAKWTTWMQKHFALVNINAEGGATPAMGVTMEKIILKAATIRTNLSEHQSTSPSKPSRSNSYVPRTITFKK